MKKYFITINGESTPCIIDLDGLKEVMCNGNKYEFEYKFISRELLLLRINGNNYTLKVEENALANTDIKNTEFLVDLDSHTHSVTCKSELDQLIEKFSKTKSSKGFKKDLISPMPGSVVKINVKEGDIVKPGTVLLVLEAMKMENELKATGDAIVDRIMVIEKKSVDKNDVLIKFLPIETSEQSK